MKEAVYTSRKKTPMGRKRTTSCWETHYSGEHCTRCTRLRARRSRARRAAHPRPPLPATHTAERAERDAQAEEHRRLIQRANAYVQSYRKRGAITPPDACEHSNRNNNRNRNDYIATRTALSAWHPDPAHPRDILSLCKNCRAIARALGEPVELRWQWPGGSRTAPCFVTPTPVWERRLRQDRLPPQTRSSTTIPPMTDAEYEQKITSALSKLDKAIVAADALLIGE